LTIHILCATIPRLRHFRTGWQSRFLIGGCFVTNTGRVCAIVIAGTVAVAMPLTNAAAQSAQPLSLQLSVLAASQEIGKKSISGFGFEGQFRYTPPALWSLGGGIQYSAHPSGEEEINIVGGFLEPRYAIDIGSDRVAPYLAARLAFLHESSSLDVDPGPALVLKDFASSGSAFGAGAGVLIRATGRINIDIGAAFVRQSFSSANSEGSTAAFKAFTGYVAKGGISIGFGSR
jgi:opacity protein-like surface antigen